MPNPEIYPEMRLFSPDGQRLYLTGVERAQFLAALGEENPVARMFCQLPHYTGCRPGEARRVLIDEQSIVYRSLKKRKVDSRGRTKQPQYRTVPVPESFIKCLDLVFDLRARQKRGKYLDKLLWSVRRSAS